MLALAFQCNLKYQYQIIAPNYGTNQTKTQKTKKKKIKPKIMSLWKKELNDDDAPMLVNLFSNIYRIREYEKWNRKLQSSSWKKMFLDEIVFPGKNQVASNYFRYKGNNLFRSKKFMKAMQCYNQSLCLAVPKTVNVCFAYANRATCFLLLEMYAECLRDIEMAVEAEYPIENMPKLMKRRARCVQKMKKAPECVVFEPQLSFPPHERFPCMANAIEIQQNDKFGRHMVATRDIGVGETVVVEESFIAYAVCNDRVQCYTCLQSMQNFIACPYCTDAMFCSAECQSQNDIHEQFCNEEIHYMPKNVTFMAISLLKAFIAFPDADQLMDFVANVLSKRHKKTLEGANDPQSMYALFLNLQPAKEDQMDMDLMYKVYTGLLKIKQVQSMFDSEHRRRFLIHLIGEHFLIVSNNSYGGPYGDESAVATTSLLMSFFNHSCAPNIFNTVAGSKHVGITIRPIVRGDQLFVTYMRGNLTTKQRQEKLRRQWGFNCKCDRCKPQWQRAQRNLIKADMFYRPFKRSLNWEKLYQTKYEPLGRDCVNFLHKFGHLPWCDEIDYVMRIYSKILLDKFPTI